MQGSLYILYIMFNTYQLKNTKDTCQDFSNT